MRIQGRIVNALGMGILLLGFSQASTAKTPVEAVPGEYVVKLKSGVSTMSMGSLSQALGGQVVEKISPQSEAVLLRRQMLENSSFVINALEQNPYVEYAEPNYIYRVVGGTTKSPSDPELGKLWGLINTGQEVSGDMPAVLGKPGIDIDAKRAWEVETGSRDVLVAVIDTGVDYTIADLRPNMWTNAAELNGTAGVDDDNNGFVDDVYGYDFANKDGDPKDDHGHGSHVSGTIAGNGDDGVGVVGVAWKAKVMGIKFLSASGGGTLEDAVKSIDYATQMGAQIMSNSWGGGGYSQALYDSIERANKKGILFVAAAGNSSSNNDEDPGYPASYDNSNIISVAAIDSTGQLASFSSYGKTSVDVAAPGVNIYSTIPGGFDAWSGTSMATPHVSGVAVLLLAKEPNLSLADLRERIIKTARPLAALNRKVASGGLVNAYHALTNTMPPADPDDPFQWDKKDHRLSSPHPYKDKFSQSWTVEVPGAKRIALYFSKFETETGYDKLTFKDANGKVVAVWSGNNTDSFSPVIEGSTVVITLETDDSQTGYGFDLDSVAYQ